MNLYAKFQEKIIFAETKTPMFFYHEVDHNLPSNYEFKNGIPVFRKNITKTFANNTFANMICFEKSEKINHIIKDHLNRICENDSNKIRNTIFKMKEALYDAIEPPILLKIFNSKNRFKIQINEFERVTNKILNELETEIESKDLRNDNNLMLNHVYNLLEDFKSNNNQFLIELEKNKKEFVQDHELILSKSIPRRSAKNFETLSIKVQNDIYACHEIDYILNAIDLRLNKYRIDLRIEIAKKLNLDLTNQIILAEVRDTGGYYHDYMKKNKFEDLQIIPILKEFASK